MRKLILLLAQLFCHHKYQYTEINHNGYNTVECKWCGKRKIVKILPLLALAFVMCGCYLVSNFEPDAGVQLIDNEEYNKKYVTTYIIDSCEYIHIQGIPGLQHKGNCKYCAESRRKEQEELINKIKKQ